MSLRKITETEKNKILKETQSMKWDEPSVLAIRGAWYDIRNLTDKQIFEEIKHMKFIYTKLTV